MIDVYELHDCHMIDTEVAQVQTCIIANVIPAQYHCTIPIQSLWSLTRDLANDYMYAPRLDSFISISLAALYSQGVATDLLLWTGLHKCIQGYLSSC